MCMFAHAGTVTRTCVSMCESASMYVCASDVVYMVETGRPRCTHHSPGVIVEHVLSGLPMVNIPVHDQNPDQQTHTTQISHHAPMTTARNNKHDQSP